MTLSTLPSTPERSGADRLDLFGAVATLMRRITIVTCVPLLAILSVLLIGILAPRTYSVSLAFVPSGQAAGASRIAGLAEQFGLSAAAGGGGGSDSPYFYADFIESPEVLHAVVSKEYTFRRGDAVMRGDLASAFRVDSAPPDLMRQVAAEELADRLDVSVATKTGVVNMTVKSEDPDLSMQLATSVLDEVNRFNREVRRSQAGQERRFVQSRVDSALVELRAAEDQLKDFLRRNRSIADAPELKFEHDRRARDVSTRAALYTSLLEGLDRARMDEVRSTPVLTVVEQAMRPAQPDRRRLATRAALAGVVGLVMGVLLAFLVTDLENRRAIDSEGAAELRRLWRSWGDRLSAATRARHDA